MAKSDVCLPIFGIINELTSGDDIDKSRQMGSKGQQRTPNAAFLRKQFSLESRHSSVSSRVDAIPRPGFKKMSDEHHQKLIKTNK